MKNDPVVAIAGATGAVGAEFIATTDNTTFAVSRLKVLASGRRRYRLSSDGSISRKFPPIAVRSGAVVVDNPSAFRMEPSVPLVIPEINAHRIREPKGIIANPNLCGDHGAVPLWWR